MHTSKRQQLHDAVRDALMTSSSHRMCTIHLSIKLSKPLGDIHTAVQRMEKRGEVVTEYEQGGAQHSYRRLTFVRLRNAI